MKEITNIFTIEVTRIQRNIKDDESNARTPEEMAKETCLALKDVFGVDDATVIRAKEFVRDTNRKPVTLRKKIGKRR